MNTITKDADVKPMSWQEATDYLRDMFPPPMYWALGRNEHTPWGVSKYSCYIFSSEELKNAPRYSGYDDTLDGCINAIRQQVEIDITPTVEEELRRYGIES